MHRRASAITLIALFGLLPSCTPNNTELTIGDPLRPRDQVVLPSIGRSAPEARSRVRARDMATRIPAQPAQGRPETSPEQVEAPEPSITGLDRSDWATTKFLVPNSKAAHQPRYTRNLIFDRTSPRARGEFPTMRSALDSPTSASSDQQIKEAAAAPFAAAADILLLPIRAVASRPWQRTRTGFVPYQRSPQERMVVPDGLLPVEPVEPVEPGEQPSAPNAQEP